MWVQYIWAFKKIADDYGWKHFVLLSDDDTLQIADSFYTFSL